MSHEKKISLSARFAQAVISQQERMNNDPEFYAEVTSYMTNPNRKKKLVEDKKASLNNEAYVIS